MDKTIQLQIPISLAKKELLDSKSEKLGFSSSVETVSFLINNFLSGSINISTKEQSREFNPESKNFHEDIIKFADE